MSWTTADIPDLKGRTAVVTGANGGLGLETSRALAAAGAHVVMAARNQEKAAAAVEDIKGTEPRRLAGAGRAGPGLPGVGQGGGGEDPRSRTTPSTCWSTTPA